MSAMSDSFVTDAQAFAARAAAIHERIAEVRKQAGAILGDALSLASDVNVYGERIANDPGIPSEKRDLMVGAIKALGMAATELTRSLGDLANG